MENIDVFESVFKRALRTPFEYERKAIERVLLVTDLEPEPLKEFESKAKDFLKGLGGPAPRWTSVGGSEYSRWKELKALIAKADPSLIVAYRLLQEVHENAKFSLGAYLDTMAQESEVPLLVLPNPDGYLSGGKAFAGLNSVMVVTDHLSGEHKLVSAGARFTAQGGMLHLCHLEDEDIFDRYLRTIAKIPEINTDTARERIREQLLDEPRAYLESVIKVLREKRPDLKVETVVEIGQVVSRYRALVGRRQVDLLVFDSKDKSQLAMHSAGYSLAVEFKDTPLLLV
ncbi:MAG: hypothetical protein V3S11_05430 [Elusimicrobiota bacterium]